MFYRHAPDSAVPPECELTAPARGATEHWDWEHGVVPDPALLFRFSALTYNAHRIHYDRDYAMQEGHPGLVVHGPFQAIALAELLRRHIPEKRVASFRFRAEGPAYDGMPLRFVGRLTAPGLAILRAIDESGTVTMTADVELVDEPH